MSDSKSPSTTVNKNAQDPKGQANTMKGTSGVFNPPNQAMHSSKNLDTGVCMDRSVKKHG